MDLIYADEVYAIQGAIYEVYKNVGTGFLESVYQECLEMELGQRGIPFVAQKEIDISYKGVTLAQKYRADIVSYERTILELKAVTKLFPEHHAQLYNYLRATNMHLGLLVNFCNYPGVDIKRIVF